MNDSSEPRVFLVGAGPGAPGLMTLRAVEVLAQADVVLYDQLVSRRLLDFASPHAELICVREMPGMQPDRYSNIHTLLLESANAGRRVVRLKGGDPLIFGRGGEEADTLRASGIPYEIVPGVTAALGAAAYLDLPLTHRNSSSALALVTGHELPMKAGGRLDWKALAAFPGTLAIYMGIARLPLIVAELTKYGRAGDTPAAIVERASTGEMRTVFSTLAQLDQARRNAGMEAPGLILIGEAVTRKVERSWFEARPLFGQRVLVTRPRLQAESMVRRLEQLGAVPYVLPTIDIRPPEDFTAFDSALDKLDRAEFDWMIFTSTNAVNAVFGRLEARGHDARRLGSVRIAAIGPKTADALKAFRIVPDLVPEKSFKTEGLLEALSPHVHGKRLLLPRADRGRELLISELEKIATVEPVVVYEQVDQIAPAAEIFDALRRGEIQYATFTSSNIAKSFIAAIDDTIRGRIERGDLRLVTLSAEIRQTIEERGLPVAGEPPTATVEGLINVLVQLVAERAETQA